MTSPAKARAVAARDRLTRWLFDEALPLWATVGTDWEHGGFFETIDPDGRPSTADRRTRVVGRQIFTFATAGSLGWQGNARRVVEHGLDYLLSRCLNADHTVKSITRPGTTLPDPGFDLYDHAFALFGLAAAYQYLDSPAALKDAATNILTALKVGWQHPVGGFEESIPPSLPLKANPHMHMFEACLAWDAALGGVNNIWRRQADEIGALALEHFIRDDGMLREFYAGDWTPMADASGAIVEPGHQFEWAWLLWTWDKARCLNRTQAKALRLYRISETHGVDPVRDLAIAEIWANLTVKDDRARLWQQTERIKCALAMADLATDEGEQTLAYDRATRAASGIERYLDYPVRGGCFEFIDHTGHTVDGDARASTMYHIICAVSEMHRLL